MEFLFLVHGVAVGYDFPKARDPVVGIIFWTCNEVQVFPLVFENYGKAAILRDILGVFFHTFCFMAWPHIPNIFNGDCGKKAEPAVSRGSVNLISTWRGILRNYSFSFSCNLWRIPFPFPPSPTFGTKESSDQKEQKEQEILKGKTLSPRSLFNKEAEYALDATLWYHVWDTNHCWEFGSSPWSIPVLIPAPIWQWGQWSCASLWTSPHRKMRGDFSKRRTGTKIVILYFAKKWKGKI